MKLKLLFLTLCAMLLSPVAWSDTTSSLTNTANQAGQFVSDSAVTAAVKTNLLADPDVKSLAISVSTDNGVVTLKGNVDNVAQQQKAIDIATKTDGVKSVKSELVINVMPAE